MTGRLVAAAAGVRGSPALLVGVWAITLALVPAVALADGVLALVLWWRLRSIYRRHSVQCPRGHLVVVRARDAAWECASCRYAAVGESAFGPCVRCGATCGFVLCACGASVPNPAFHLLAAP